MRDKRLKRHWDSWGKAHPFFATLSAPRYRGAELSVEELNSFYASGEEHIERVLRRSEQLFGPLRREAALDYGCGPGRLLRPLLDRFAEVYGTDISSEMLARAREHCGTTTSLTLRPAGTDGLVGMQGLDFIHSYIVFQHIPWRRGAEIIERLATCLAPGGVAALDLPYLRHASSARRMNQALRYAVPPYHRICNLVSGNPASDPLILMNAYDLGSLLGRLRAAGIEQVILDLGRDGQFEKCYLFFRRA